MKLRMLNNGLGMSLIELLVVIVVIGILTAVSMKTMTTSVEDLKRTRTERELDALEKAIVGDPNETNDLARSNFGYVGDVGAFPPNLAALRTNPGGYATWNGPYLRPGIVEDSLGFQYDEWGKPYSYTGGLTISSTGNGTAIVKKVAAATSNYLLNRFVGTVEDINDSLPGPTKKDSVTVLVTIPNGIGGLSVKSYHPDQVGSFTLDSIPAGKHQLRIIYVPQNDTIERTIIVLPRHNNSAPPIYKFASAYFAFGVGCGSTLTIRPDGPGSSTGLTSTGCGANWQCVSETVADENTTRVWWNSSPYHEDYYSFTNPTAPACSPTKVTVFCRANRSSNKGNVRPVISIGGTTYQGTQKALSSTFINYSYSWTKNPKTSVPWTWSDINNLQAGVRLTGASGTKYAYCTQVWIVVTY